MGQGQPYLHDLVALIDAPSQAWCSESGDIAVGSVGVIAHDVQVVAGLRLTLAGEAVTWLRRYVAGSTVTFVGIARHLQDESATGADPRVTVMRTRRLTRAVVEETVEVQSALEHAVPLVVEVELVPALDPIDQVKAGRHRPVRAVRDGDAVRWLNDSVAVRLSSDAPLVVSDAAVRVRQETTVTARGSSGLRWQVSVDAAGTVPIVAATRPASFAVAEPGWPLPGTRARRWLDQSLADLSSLRLEHRAAPGQAFFGAGAPWYLTLFGRDSLWAARLCRALDPATATSTLRVLAALQGERHEPATEEAPGKILHEIRGSEFTALPHRYYGTVDATALWVALLIDLEDDGDLTDAERNEFAPALRAALAWLTGPYADSDGDGFVDYAQPAGRGLVNQGWKDSVDAVRFADGRIAAGPIALCEVQGYAYEAATRGAALLERHDSGSGQAAAHWARRLRERFQARFCRDGFPQFALDGGHNLVDATTSNIGHLLGTGILDPEQEWAVADRLLEPDMFTGLGLRTMSSRDGGYNPLSYHCGSVWAHDTGIVIDAMLRAGLLEHAQHLAGGLLAAADIFADRLPELWSGHADLGVPYPAACRPQAWAAAAAVPAIQALQAGRLPHTGQST